MVQSQPAFQVPSVMLDSYDLLIFFIILSFMKTCLQTLVLFMLYILQSRLSVDASRKHRAWPRNQHLTIREAGKKLCARPGSYGVLPPTDGQLVRRGGRKRNITSWHVMVQNPSLDGTMSLNSTENVATFGWQGQIML